MVGPNRRFPPTFPLIFRAFIYTVSDELKIEFMGTKGASQRYTATAKTYSQPDQNNYTCFFLVVQMYELTRGRGGGEIKVLFYFIFDILSHFS